MWWIYYNLFSEYAICVWNIYRKMVSIANTSNTNELRTKFCQMFVLRKLNLLGNSLWLFEWNVFAETVESTEIRAFNIWFFIWMENCIAPVRSRKRKKKLNIFQLFLRNSNRVQSNFRTRQYILHQRLCVHNGRDGKHSRASAREIAEKWIIIIRFNISNKSYGSFCRVAALHHTSKSEKHASANDMHLKFICAHLCHWRLWWRYVRMPLTGVTINFSEHF